LEHTSKYVYLCSVMNDTRQQILESNFKAIHRNGFNATRADKVILGLGITKGALYHYFPTKKALGYAVVDELLYKSYVGALEPLLSTEGNPIDFISAYFTQQYSRCSDKEISLGCPLNNLIQEMSPTDEGFRTRLERIVNGMHDILKTGLAKGQKNGLVSKKVSASEVAWFVIAAMEGAYAMAKVTKSKETFKQAIGHAQQYLNSLKL
jgi:TetR/AcrR family transcriptional repressor of nem operon